MRRYYHKHGPPYAGRALGESPEVFWFCSGVPVPAANAILGGRFADPSAGVAEVLSHFYGFPVDWELAPQDVTPAFCAALARHGYAQIELRPGMLCSLDAPTPQSPAPPSNCVISASMGPEDLRDIARVMGEAFLMQDDGAGWLRHHLAMGAPVPEPYVQLVARIGGEAVATAGVLMQDGVAGIYAVGTRTAWRGRGLGSAVTRAAMDVARARGCHTAMLQASAAGLRVYEKLGFRVVCEHEVWSDLAGT